MEYYPEVVQAIAIEKKNIIVYFSDGRITQYNVQPLIERGGVFTRLRGDKFFSGNLTVMNGTAAWDLSGNHDPGECIDIDPVVLYHARIVKDPLETVKRAEAG